MGLWNRIYMEKVFLKCGKLSHRTGRYKQTLNETGNISDY